MKPYKLGKNSGSRWPKVLLFLVVVALVVGVAAFFGLKNLYTRNLEPVNISATEDIVFTIQSGSSVDRISKDLEAKKIIRSSRVFLQYTRTNGLMEDFKAGTYKLRQSMSVQEIATILTEGRVAEDLFTVLPGSSVATIKKALIAAGYTEAEATKALDPASYPNHPALVDKPVAANLEGYIYADSYQQISGLTKATEVIKLALNEMAEALTPDIRAGIASQGLSVYDGIKLASIVEKEVSGNNPDDRPKVAQVFLSRLDIGMKLQSNATDGWPNDYDTYSIPGLPPTPISNVSQNSLQAVAKPAETDYLYFVSGTDCVTRFSRTQAEHESLIAKHGVARAENRCT